MLVLLLLLVLFSVPNIICHRDYQTIPLRYESAIDYLKQYQHSNFIHLLDDVSTYSITPERISSYISSVANDEPTQCERDFEIILQGVLNRDMWALKVIDAWGKPSPSGILKGNTYWVGDYDECLQPLYITSNKTFVSQPFDTQYCTLFPSPGSISFDLGLCVPSSCDRQGVVSLIHRFFENSTVTKDVLLCSNEPPNGQEGLTSGALATIIILSILGILVLVGTIVDLILLSRLDEAGDMTSNINGYDYVTDTVITERTSLNLPRYSRNSVQALIDTTPRTAFLAEFSALRSLRRIFTTKQKKNDNESYPFINGIRVLSLFWVIIGHSFLFGILYSSNPLDLITWTRNVSIQLISTAVFSVDTFFVLSGFLTTILFVRQVEKDGKLSFRLMVLYYIHRYIRLTPTFLLMVAISINLTPYFGSGPVYPTQAGFEVPQCRTQYWWTSILYVSNIIKPDYMCLGVSWYLHNDMQFHWIAPLTLIPFVMKRKPIAFIMSILFTLVGIGSIAGILISNPNLQASAGFTAPPVPGPTFFNSIYVTPWCRLSAYFVGVLTGFLVVNTGPSYRMNKCIIILCSILAILFALICMFAIYPDNILVPGIDKTSFILYQSLSRTLWSLAIGWLLFLCMTNRGGIINKILSWPVWAPFARLNYATYLIHLTIIFVMITSQRLPFYFQPHLVINNMIAQTFVSYLIAIVVVIFIETPFFIIEKKLFKR